MWVNQRLRHPKSTVGLCQPCGSSKCCCQNPWPRRWKGTFPGLQFFESNAKINKKITRVEQQPTAAIGFVKIIEFDMLPKTNAQKCALAKKIKFSCATSSACAICYLICIINANAKNSSSTFGSSSPWKWSALSCPCQFSLSNWCLASATQVCKAVFRTTRNSRRLLRHKYTYIVGLVDIYIYIFITCCFKNIYDIYLNLG